MKTSDELKAELAELEGQPAPAAALELSRDEQFASIFDQLDHTDGTDRYKAYLAQENSTRKACPRCWRRRAIANETCELCGYRPVTWLLSEEPWPERDVMCNIIDDRRNVLVPAGPGAGAYLADHNARSWRRWASSTATVQELKGTIAGACAPDQIWKARHAASILRLLGEEIPLGYRGEIYDGDLSGFEVKRPRQE